MVENDIAPQSVLLKDLSILCFSRSQYRVIQIIGHTNLNNVVMEDVYVVGFDRRM